MDGYICFVNYTTMNEERQKQTIETQQIVEKAKFLVDNMDESIEKDMIILLLNVCRTQTLTIKLYEDSRTA